MNTIKHKLFYPRCSLLFFYNLKYKLMTETWLNIILPTANAYIASQTSFISLSHAVFLVGFNFIQLSVDSYKMQVITHSNTVLPTPSIYSFLTESPRKPPTLCYHGFMHLLAAKAGDVEVHLPPAFTAAPLGTTFSTSRKKAMARI